MVGQRNIRRRSEEIGVVQPGRECMGQSQGSVVLSCPVELHLYIWSSLGFAIFKILCCDSLPSSLQNKTFFLFNFLEYVRHHDVELSGVQVKLLLLISLMNK